MTTTLTPDDIARDVLEIRAGRVSLVPPVEPAPPVVPMIALRSGNAKTGPIPTISRPQSTCPFDCPLLGSGCYGENRGQGGRPSSFQMVAKAKPTISVREIADRAPKAAPAVRFNVVGDYFAPDGEPDWDYILDTNHVASSRPWTAISYTHGWRRLEPHMFSYVVRASCQTKAEVEEAHARGWYSAVVDPGPEDPDTLIGTKIDGRQVVQCPATNGKARSCAECRLCGREAAVVAFPVHGARRSTVRRVVDALRKEQA